MTISLPFGWSCAALQLDIRACARAPPFTQIQSHPPCPASDNKGLCLANCEHHKQSRATNVLTCTQSCCLATTTLVQMCTSHPAITDSVRFSTCPVTNVQQPLRLRVHSCVSAEGAGSATTTPGMPDVSTGHLSAGRAGGGGGWGEPGPSST